VISFLSFSKRIFPRKKYRIELECFFTFFSGVKRNLSLFTKTVSFLSCVNDAQEILKNLRKICDEKAKALLKALQNIFGFVGSVCDSTAFILIILVAECPFYKTAKFIKDTATLIKNLLAICLFIIILRFPVKKFQNSMQPSKKINKKAMRKKPEELTMQRSDSKIIRGTKYDFAVAVLHVISLMSTLNIIPIQCRVATIILDNIRYILKIKRHIVCLTEK